MDLQKHLQKSTNFVDNQRKKKRIRDAKDVENSNKIAEAIKLFLKSQNVARFDYADQETYLKYVQTHYLNLCQWSLSVPREFIHVKILNGVTPKELFVVKKSDEGKLNDFQRELTKDYTNNKHQLVYCLKKGFVCVAATTNGWQRCQILKLYEKQFCDVLLFDIGLKERVNWQNLRIISEKWIDYKPLAVRCSLINVTTARPIVRITVQQQQAFSQILKNQKNFYIFVNQPSVISSDVFLYYKHEGQFYCVNEIFTCDTEQTSDDDNCLSTESSKNIERIAASRGVSQPAQSQNITMKRAEESPPPKLQVNQNVREFEEESPNFNPPPNKLCLPEPVAIKHIDGIDGIYVCFEKYLNGLNRLRFELLTYAQDQPSNGETIWKAGDYCLVFDLFEGYSEWLRGKIISVLDGDRCQIYLRDVGKAIESSCKHMIPISNELNKVRDFTWKMKLAFIKIEKRSTVEMVNEVLNDTVRTYDGMAISAVGDCQSSEWDIILWGIKRGCQALLPEKIEYININQELVKWGIATTLVSFDEINRLIKPTYEDYEDTTEIQLNLPNQVTDQKMEVKQWLPSEPIFMREFVAFPMHVSQKCMLSILEENRKTISDQIEAILVRKYRAKELIKLNALEWKKEDACFARYDGDRQFYRATVRRVNFTKNTCVVRFVDYGNCETCSLDDLRKANMFGDIPALARLYRLENIKPSSEDGLWPEHVRQFCMRAVCHKQCNLIVTDSSRDDSKSLYEADSCKLEIFTKDKDLATALVKRGYAKWIDDSVKK